MAEQDWSRYIDYLQDLPRNTLFICENGDPRLFKDKLGKHNILTGFYPLVSFKTETTEKCIDMAKELIDVLAPGGGYIFQFDKDIISSDGMDLNKISAVCEYVRDNTKYANSGQTAERSFNAEDYAARAKEPVMKKSKYYHTEENYKAYSTEVTDYAASKLHKSDLDLVRTLTTFLY